MEKSTSKNQACAAIVFSHGSRREEGICRIVELVCQDIAAQTPALLKVCPAYMSFNQPDMQSAVAECVAAGADKIIILPYFLYDGIHITQDIPELITQMEGKYPGVEFCLTDSLGYNPLLSLLMQHKLGRLLPKSQLACIYPNMHSSHPVQIENASMDLIEELLPENNYTPAEKAVAKRLIHASGDPGIVNYLVFSPGAAEKTVELLKNGADIITDVKMVLAGIKTALAEEFGCRVSCPLADLKTPKNVSGNALTRSQIAMQNTGRKLENAVVAIGNAPTALLSLLDIVSQLGIKPGVVIGMPVGFIQAAESKDLLMASDIPFISIRGNRGGSNLAAATVNALLLQAEKQVLCPR